MQNARTGLSGAGDAIYIRNTNIFMCETGVYLDQGGSNNASRVTIEDSTIAANGRQAVRIRGSRRKPFVTFRNCTFVRNKRYGIYATENVRLLLDNVVISDNIGQAFYLWSSSSASLEIKDSIFERNEDTAIRYFTYSNEIEKSLKISSSIFRHNKQKSIDIEDSSEDIKLEWQITGNTFEYNNLDSINVILNEGVKKSVNLTLKDNIFRNASSEYPIRFDIRSKSPMHFDIERNTFIDSKKAIYWLMTQTIQQSTLMISRNVFRGMYGEHVLYLDADYLKVTDNKFIDCSSHTIIHMLKGLGSVLRGNSFISPIVKSNIAVDVPFTKSRVIEASHNFWGNADGPYIRSMICDFYCRMDVAEMNLTPYYLTSALTSLSTSSENTGFVLRADGTGGGKLSRSMAIREGSFRISRSIYIPRGTTLTLERGVSFTFADGRGIYAEGNYMGIIKF